MAQKLKVGDTVYVPWGLEEPVAATVVELWGEPPTQVRVQLHLGDSDGDDDDEPVVLLLSPSVFIAA
jgi:hypothetical protein